MMKKILSKMNEIITASGSALNDGEAKETFLRAEFERLYKLLGEYLEDSAIP